MATFREALGAAVKAATCESIANQKDSWFGNLREKIVPEDVKTFFDTFNCTLCDNCEESEAPEPPFEGGQCGALYEFQVATTAPTSGGGGECGLGTASGSVTNQLWGPIGGIRPGDFFCTGPNGVARNWEMTAFGTGADSQPNSVPQSYVVATNAYTAIPGGFTRVDNQPDDCGNPPIESPPPGNIETTVNITYEGDDGDITIPFGLIFAPVYFDFDGSLNVPIRLNGPLFSLDGDIKLFPDFDLSIKPTQTGDNGPGEVDNPGIDDGEPGLDGEEPPNGPDSTIIGVYVRSQISGRNLTTLIPDSPGPDILAPGIATVRFAIRAGGLTAWTNDIRVKGVNEFVYCPVPWGAVNVSVRSEAGWANSFTVLRGKPLTEFSP